ncbi:hypothetical protein CHARACLAT_023162 [Characodon lateralis]|uniref:Uncharacterized protein n=1 Tax=Characodon lateralis TaxID=208331 RepID=A0ABU7EWK8_9TELE|nr:hypothetical protein [Characodon lateralis]
MVLRGQIFLWLRSREIHGDQCLEEKCNNGLFQRSGSGAGDLRGADARTDHKLKLERALKCQDEDED